MYGEHVLMLLPQRLAKLQMNYILCHILEAMSLPRLDKHFYKHIHKYTELFCFIFNE